MIEDMLPKITDPDVLELTLRRPERDLSGAPKGSSEA
jgi:hypothetical protein